MVATGVRSRRLLLAGAVLTAAVALALVVGVIPPVRSDTFPGATPERAAAAFRVHAGVDLLAAMALVWMSFRALVRSRASTAAFSVMGVLLVLLGIALADAGSASSGHGPEMAATARLLFACTAAEIVAAALVIAAAILRVRRT